MTGLWALLLPAGWNCCAWHRFNIIYTMSRERETIEKKVPRNDFLNDFNFETPCLNGTITEKKITHMEIS